MTSGNRHSSVAQPWLMEDSDRNLIARKPGCLIEIYGDLLCDRDRLLESLLIYSVVME
ncbi:hypothetical protein H6G89_33955 [Oscillatoria sp. FACHB-1407]|uniref:hypothetical protein n=1 Tax=Oscillatoria sp. FACHB-1407 TaxID=2692847 RepID=UPI0016828A18|nr:hypothetical protein [Oscillatoria sp. FACHB-1407]MBD2465992.1 hypothetical protein [Oscillatoria sp. FACHB-1407]